MDEKKSEKIKSFKNEYFFLVKKKKEEENFIPLFISFGPRFL